MIRPEERKEPSFEVLVRRAQALDAVKHGGKFRTSWGERFIIPHRNPYGEVDAMRQERDR